MNFYSVVYWTVISSIVAFISYQYYYYNQLTLDLFGRLCVVWGFIGWVIKFWLDEKLKSQRK